MELGTQFKLIFPDVPFDELRRRLAKRNESLPAKSGFRMDLDQLDVASARSGAEHELSLAAGP